MTENQSPEQKAHDNIDAMLRQAGWKVQDKKNIDLNDGLEKGQNITAIELQSDSYAAAKLKWVNNRKPLPYHKDGVPS